MTEVDRSIKVVGVTAYQDNIWTSVGACDICTGDEPGPCRTDHRYVTHIVPMVLLAEGDNRMDELSISVWIEHSEVGHWARGTTRAMHAILRDYGPMRTDGRVYGKRERDGLRGTLGIRLDDVAIYEWERDPWFAGSGPADVRIYTPVPAWH